MAYYSSDGYAQIIADPSSILTLYDTNRDAFRALTGLQAASEGACIAAFCSVVAYEMKPYGASDAQILSELLATPAISCAQYVRLALYLTEEFGRNDIEAHGIGWDLGNSVPNHAQLFISSGGTDLLLDPTIGLIMRGATIAGVASGVAYGPENAVSFYDWNRTEGTDLDAFNNAVFNALDDGSFRHQYAIWDCATADEINSISLHRGLEIGDAKSGSHYDDVFSWSGTAWGGRGNDVLTGDIGTDRLHGGDDNDRLYGAAGNDEIFGDLGDDRMDGGIGADYMAGGLGDDLYLVNSSGDRVIEAADGGTRDQMVADTGHIILAANVEIGRVTGNLALKVTGNSGDNILYGNSNNNYITGGGGCDQLVGGGGADCFDFNSVMDARSGDTIVDFQDGLDYIDLRTIDANTRIAGNQDFTFVDTREFSGAGAELRWDNSGRHVIVEADVNGDAIADMSIVIRNLSSFGWGDFYN